MTGRELARQALASRERSRRWPWSELAYGKAASVGGLFIPNVTYWQKRREDGPAALRGMRDIRRASSVGYYGGSGLTNCARPGDHFRNGSKTEELKVSITSPLLGG